MMQQIQNSATRRVIAETRDGRIQFMHHIQDSTRGVERQKMRPAARFGPASMSYDQPALCRDKDVQAVTAKIGAENTIVSGVEEHHLRMGSVLALLVGSETHFLKNARNTFYESVCAYWKYVIRTAAMYCNDQLRTIGRDSQIPWSYR